MKGGGACMVGSFERWREPGWRLQLFLQGAILYNLENLWPSTTSAITAVASSDLEVAADSAVVVGGRNKGVGCVIEVWQKVANKCI